MSFLEDCEKIIYRKAVIDHVKQCLVMNHQAAERVIKYQVNNQLSTSYKIEESEFGFCADMLMDYSANLNALLIDGNLRICKEYAKETDEEFFYMSLFSYLVKYASETHYYSQSLLVYQENVDSCTIKYQLTEYGRAFYKMLLAAATVEKEHNGNVRIDGYKEILNDGTTELMYYIS